MVDKERYKRIKEEMKWDWSDISYVVNQDDVKWFMEQAEKADRVQRLYKSDVNYYMREYKNKSREVERLKEERDYWKEKFLLHYDIEPRKGD